MAGLFVRLNNAKRSNGALVPVDSYAAASAYLRQQQDAVGYQGPDDETVWPRGAMIYETVGGPVVAHVSQNGKVWPGREWSAGVAPLFTPSN